MNAFSLKKLAKNYMQIWNVESEGLLDIYADNDLQVEYTHYGKTYVGIAENKTMLQTTYRFFPDMKVHIDQTIVSKKTGKVTLFWSYSGTHQEGELFGFAPSGKPVTVNAMTVLTIDKKRVVHEKGLVDNMSLLMQLQQNSKNNK